MMSITNIPQKPLIDWLTYISYERQRIAFPEIPHFKWRQVYADAVQFEEIFDNYMNAKIGA